MTRQSIPLVLLAVLITGCNSLQVKDTTTLSEPVGAESNAATSVDTNPALTDSTAADGRGTDEGRADADLWQRIRDGLSLKGHTHTRIDQELAWFQSHPDYMERVSRRAEPFLHLIVEEVERRGLPMELALLPVVESGFQPFAYSHGRAAGLWQFIPSTGRMFGLQQNWWYDGRRDVLRSTHAALDYLEQLHERFDGDWLKAVASYNAGAGNVSRAMRRNAAAGKPQDFWHLDVPRETRAYVPRLLAVARFVADPERYGIALHPIANEHRLTLVRVDSQIDLAIAAETAGMDMDELHHLNPAYNRWATPPQGPHDLLMPLDKATAFRAAIADLAPDQRLRWYRHVVKSGDVLGRIARKYGTTVAQLKQTNNLRSDRVRVGQALLVPTPAAARAEYSLSADQRLKATQARIKGSTVRYTVRDGDTLWDIARAHGVSHRKLARWNGMAPGDPLRPGRSLVIKSSKKQVANSRAEATTLPANIRNQRVVYRVRSGDSLYRIAQRFRVSVNQIRNWNGLKKGRYLRPGQRLVLHVDVTRQS
ncbi:MAG: LysM peptidoglycan-binding domain-containing protein [Gammaproteobacteria bacterium]